MKVPTFYSSKQDGNGITYVFFIFFVGVVFGGIHCAGWFFHFPSSDEAMLWQVSSVVITGIALLLLLLIYLVHVELFNSDRWETRIFAFTTIILLLYVVSRLLLLVEAFISLRQLTPGMLALVK